MCFLAAALSLNAAAQTKPGFADRLTVGGYGEVALTRNFFSDNVYRYSNASDYADDPSHGRFDIPHMVVYHNPVFISLWIVLSVSGLVCIFRKRMQAFPFTLLMHLSFIVILCGALVTHLSAREFRLNLRIGEPDNELPFELTLTDFDVERYTGSMAASDYRSIVRITDGPVMEISMNHIGRFHGYRFYQTSYDSDMGGSIISVSHDPWGVGLTYSGYFLLIVSLIGFFFQKESSFRNVLRKVASASICLFLLPQIVSARSDHEIPPAIPEDVADEFSKLLVYYNDRIAPFQTLARDYCMKAYGKPSFDGYTAEQVVTGWLFYYDWWTVVPFKLKDKDKDKGTEKEAEKEALRMSAATGEAFRIFPIAFSDSLRNANPGLPEAVWFSCEDPLPEGLDYDRWVFIRRTLDLIHDEVVAENWPEVSRIVSKIRKYQEKVAAPVLPSPARIKSERFYNRISRPMIPFMVSITLGIILFILYGFRTGRGLRTPKRESFILAGITLLLFVYLTLVLGLGWYVSGHAPFAGSYSVMLLIAWISSLAMLFMFKRFPLVQPLGFILSGFTMLMASMASSNPQVTHLMPVLQSPLLSVHVLSMMISYTLLGLVALNGIMGLAVPAGDPDDGPRRRLMDVSLLILYPAVFLLTAGTFLGAVWANVSWGCYWTWDPKETWALVTILTYSAALHGGSLKVFRNPVFFHCFSIIAFITVLITYFGVNFILGGMHSYA